MIPTCIPTSAVQKEAFPLAGMLRVVKFFSLNGIANLLSIVKVFSPSAPVRMYTNVNVFDLSKMAGMFTNLGVFSLPKTNDNATNIDIQNRSKPDTKAPNEARLTVIRVSNEPHLGVIAPIQQLTILKRVSVEEPQPLKGYDYDADYQENVRTSSRRQDHSCRPLTPPYVRFRIRRFMLTLELPVLFGQ